MPTRWHYTAVAALVATVARGVASAASATTAAAANASQPCVVEGACGEVAEERVASSRQLRGRSSNELYDVASVKVHNFPPSATSFSYCSNGCPGGIPVDVYLPRGWKDGSKATTPLLIMLHGWHNEPADVWRDFGFEDVTNEWGPSWIVATPPGRIAPDGRFWAAWGGACGSCGPTPSDKYYAQEDCNGGANVNTDIDYIKQVVKAIQNAYSSVDARRIYLFGHSNGAYMAYRMACDVGSEVFAGIVAFAGAFPEDDSLGRHAKYTCKARNPAPFLHIHGTDDTNVKWDGFPGGAHSWRYGAPADSVGRLAKAYASNKGSSCSAHSNSYLPCDAYSKDLVPRYATTTLLMGRSGKHDTEVYNITGHAPISFWKAVGMCHHPSKQGCTGLSGGVDQWYYYEPAVKRWLLSHVNHA